jgi:hypothetical protein
MSSEVSERTYLEDVVLPQLRSEGFEVFLYPKAEVLPAFLQGFGPDAIAIRDDKKYIIEVKRGKVEDKSPDLGRMRAAVLNHPSWELKVYFISPSGNAEAVLPVSHDQLQHTLRVVCQLNESDQTRKAALLLAWATLEGASRALYPDSFVRPQSPGRVVEALANRGDISTADAALMRVLANTRNKLIHGQVDLLVTREDIAAFVRVLTELLSYQNEVTSYTSPP